MAGRTVSGGATDTVSSGVTDTGDLVTDPGSLLIRDPGLWAALLGWAVTAAVLIYR